MKVIFERRNSPSPKNSLKKFEVFDAILTSLTESTYIEVEVRDGRVVLRNRKYFLSLPEEQLITEIVLKTVVLRRFSLRLPDRILLYGLAQEGKVKFGRVDESTMDDYPSCRVIEIVC